MDINLPDMSGLNKDEAQVPRTARLRTLLYVDDNPVDRKLVENIVAHHPDIRLLSAVNGNSGVKIAHDSQPEVILMDINLPDINGFEALKLLRLDPTTAHIPVIAVSANAMPLDIERGVKAGFFRYITKPIKVDEFMEALAVALKFSGKKPANSKLDGGLMALIVEDDNRSSYLLQFILKREGYRVELARNGRDAQHMIGELEPPALVMLDVMLPYVDGFQLLGLMREKPAWKDVPILMLTAKSQEKDIVRALDAGANDYIVKPFKLDELRARIKRLVRHDA